MLKSGNFCIFSANKFIVVNSLQTNFRKNRPKPSKSEQYLQKQGFSKEKKQFHKMKTLQK